MTTNTKDVVNKELLAEKFLKAIMDGEGQKVYDYMSQEGPHKGTFLNLYESDASVKTENEMDPQETYLKGLVDGMILFRDLLVISQDSLEGESEKSR